MFDQPCLSILSAVSFSSQLSEEAAKKEDELNELEDDMERLRNRLQEPSEKNQDEVTNLSIVTKLLKD